MTHILNDTYLTITHPLENKTQDFFLSWIWNIDFFFWINRLKKSNYAYITYNPFSINQMGEVRHIGNSQMSWKHIHRHWKYWNISFHGKSRKYVIPDTRGRLLRQLNVYWSPFQRKVTFNMMWGFGNREGNTLL